MQRSDIKALNTSDRTGPRVPFSTPEARAVVERWLGAAPLPCAKLLYGGRSYLIRSSTKVAQLVAAAEPTTAANR